ncbi:MAG: SanA/YdcF family protein [Chitinophagaceae bacterium]
MITFLIILMLGGLFGSWLLAMICFLKIRNSSRHFIFSQVDKIQVNPVGLVLGTAKHAPNGGLNHFYQYRMAAAARLYSSGKIHHLLVSGAKYSVQYNEPRDMKESLINRGVPEKLILLDEGGFRTLASMRRCLEVFGQQEVTVISQRFHLERALFIGRKLGMKVVGFCAEDVRGKYWWKMWIREFFARVKCMWELFLLGALQKKVKSSSG